ncbi:integrin alpha beta-propeller repeat protein [Calothrix sp. NIES-2100]|uniref:WD40 repeat domain-containing protein n=1 Tax=Calothrix sp. NIES-2100 TaxID=1954172 RepID=UPI000B5E0340|nr:integrin alpha beta-propeller repeat protein [Calothrix sp. NIES-2100]
MAITNFLVEQTLVNPSFNSVLFANAVAISGTNALISSVGGEEGESDIAKVYLFDTLTGQRLQTYFNPTPKSGDLFGNSIAISDNKVLIGAPRDNDKGGVYLYDQLTGKLLLTFFKNNPVGGDYFGYSVAMSGDKVLIGTPYDDQGAPNSGRAYLYDAKTGELLQTFDNPTPEGGDLFGFAVAISGNTVVISAFLDDTGAADTGSAYVFDAVTGQLVHTLLNPNPGDADLFGSAVDIDGDKILVGARADDLGAVDAGAAYMFDAVTGNLLHTFANPTPEPGDIFGVSVAISGNQVLIGASGDNTGASNSGATYLFDATTGKLSETFTNPSAAEGDLFGNAVDIDGDHVVIGAFGDDEKGANTGAAYVFEKANHKYYVSSNESGTVGGVSYKDEDILAYDTKDGTWSRFFDGSKVGLGDLNVDVDAFYVEDDGSILLSVNKSGITLPGGLTIDNSDIVRFKPSTSGDYSTGTYELYLDGSEVGLEDSANENIDAIAFAPDGGLVISVNGHFNASGITAKDEDLLAFNPTSNTWELYFVGAQLGLNTNTDEDVDAAWIDREGDIFLSTRRDYTVGIGDTSISGNGSSIFTVDLNSNNTIGNVTPFWDAATAGLLGGVDGFQIL